MNLSEPFIRRPVMTTMVTVGVIIFGIMAYQKLAVSDLPSVSYPIITVSASNPGSDPETMANNVATPLEQQMMAIPGLDVVVSSSNYGNTTIVLKFDLDKDINTASTDVVAAINNASGNLPPEMPNPPSYKKANPSDAPIMYIAVSSETMTLADLYDYGNSAISQRLSMLAGVSEVALYGSKRVIRVKVNPDKLAAMNLGINDVSEAIVEANQNLPSGTVYDDYISYTIIPNGQILEGRDYDEVIIAEREGKPVFLKDVGYGIDDVENEDFYLKYWERGKGDIPSVVMAVTKQPGANTIQLCDTIKNLLPELKKELPPAINLSIINDRSIMIESSINDVLVTLLIAFVLVVFVIFLFLGKVTTTIIPSISLPVSLLGTFAIMFVNNYSVDILSMLGLTLVIGFLVDDAIVVLENIVRHLDMGKTPFQAALDGSKQISTTVLSMTLSLSTVFIPMIFMPGIIGRMFHEMAMVVVISVLISGSISLILTPTLCSKFLVATKEKSWLENKADRIVGWLLGLYEPALLWVMKKRWVPISVGGLTLALAYILFTMVPTDFLPPGDTGSIQGLTIANEDISLKAMARKQDQVTDIVKQNPNIKNIISVANIPQFVPSNQGIVFSNLIDIDKRPPIDEVTEQLNKALQESIGIRTFLRPVPQINLSVGTGVQRADYKYVLSGIGDPRKIYKDANQLLEKLKKLPEIKDVSIDIESASPQISVNILRDQASAYGISVKTIEKAFQLGYSLARVNTYQTPLNVYNVVVEMDDQYRNRPDSLDKIRLKSNSTDPNASLVPLRSVAEWIEDIGPLQVNHTNQLPSATFYFNIASGVPLSTALQKVGSVANETIPTEIIRTFQGEAQIFEAVVAQMGPLFLIGVIIIYLLLGSLYENFYHPLTILSSLPGAVFGGLLTLFVFKASLSLYAYVGLIVLIGIVLKNGIMLVEFANEKHLEGEEVEESIIEACKVRFRPILMTTIAAAMGALPIAIGIGADASTRRPMGLIILGGLLFAQFITYFFTPVVCYYSIKK